MSLDVKQKYQFYSEEYGITLDILKMSNDDVYLNIQQINNLFDNTFDEWIHSNEDHLEFKAIQYYDIHGYKNYKDYLNDIIQIINDVKYYSIHCMFRYISDNNMDFSEDLYNFYRSL